MTESPPGANTALTAQVNDPQWLFGELNKRFKVCPSSDAQLRVTAHIRERTGHQNIIQFRSRHDATLQVPILKECLTAVMKNDFSALLGTVPAGQAQVKAPPAKPKEEPETIPDDPGTPKARQETPESPQAEPAARVEPAAVQPAQRPVASKAGGKAEILAALAELLDQRQESSPTLDPDQVRAIATEIVASHIKELGTDLRGTVQNQMDDAVNTARVRVSDYLKSIPPRDVVEIRKWDGSVKEITGLRHKQLPKVIKATTARTRSGRPVPGWWYGAPGAGKTQMWAQVAQGLSLPYYPIALGPTTTEGKLLGYRNLATGSFVEGLLYKPWREGGLVNLDECDNTDPSVLVGCNALGSNDEFMFPNGEIVKRHTDFYLVASANTLGTGAMGGFTRNKLDAATLDRFAKFKLEYDRDLESALCGNEKWAEYVWKVREYVEKNCSQSIYITPRASINGAALLANGLEPDDVAESTLFATMSKDIKATILNKVGAFT